MTDSITPVAAPGGFVPQVAMTFGRATLPAVAVDESHALPVASAAPDYQGMTLSAGQSLGAGIDLGAQRLHRLLVPAGWTAAAITFQASHDGNAWSDLYDRDGEVTLAAGVIGSGGRAVVVDPAAFLGVRYLRVRSGIAAAPVVQADVRALVLATVSR